MFNIPNLPPTGFNTSLSNIEFWIRIFTYNAVDGGSPCNAILRGDTPTQADVMDYSKE